MRQSIGGGRTNEIVWRFSRRLASRDDLLRVIVEQGDECFVGVCVAPEETFGLQCLQIETIEERAIAFRRSTGAGKKDRITVLHDRALTVDGVCDRCARSEEHTSELQSRGLISYAVFCLKKK